MYNSPLTVLDRSFSQCLFLFTVFLSIHPRLYLFLSLSALFNFAIFIANPHVTFIANQSTELALLEWRRALVRASVEDERIRDLALKRNGVMSRSWISLVPVHLFSIGCISVRCLDLNIL